MITIAIELNHIVRNINKQILKYYKKDIDQSLDLDVIDENDDVFKYAKFETKRQKGEFIYIDYPYELFGCAKTMDKDLPRIMNAWLAELTNYEDDEVNVIFYGLDEQALSIQSTYFFLSRIGTRVRKVVFPRKIEELENECDVVVTTTPDVINTLKNKFRILINRPTNEGVESDLKYDSLADMINDDNLLKNLYEYKHG